MKLTEREREVIQRICAGKTSKEIAHDLGITEQGVKAHISRLFAKFGVTNRAGLVNAARDLNEARRAASEARSKKRIEELERQNRELRARVTKPD